MGVKREKAIKIIKKTGRVLLWILGFFVYLIAALVISLRNPKVQTYVCQQLAAYMSDELQTKVSIRHVDVEFVKTVVLEGLYVGDKHNDTILYAGQFKMDISRFSYDSRQMKINAIDLYDSKIKLKKYPNERGLSYRFIMLYFKSTDTTRTKSKHPWKIEFGNLGLHNVSFVFTDTRYNDDDPGMDYEDIRVTGINTEVTDIEPMGDSASFRINHLRAREQCGFAVNDMNALMTVADTFARFDNLSIITPGSDISGFIGFQFHETDDIADDFIHRVKMDGHFSKSEVEMGEIGYFAPELLGMKMKVNLTGDLKGTVEHLRCKNIDLKFGERSHVTGNFSFNGLPNIDETDMNFNIREAVTNKKDLENIPVAPFGKGDSVDVPENVALLGDMRFTGSFEGFIHDFVAHGTLTTAIGSVRLDNVAMTRLNDSLPYSYTGHVHSNAFNVGSYFNVPDMSTVTGDLDVQGSGFTSEEIDANVKGSVSSLVYNGYPYQGIVIDRAHLKHQVIDGDFTVKDPNLRLTFDGIVDNSGKLPLFKFDAHIDSANLGNLQFLDSTHEYLLSADLHMYFSGDNIDNIDGRVDVSNLVYSKDGGRYSFNEFSLNAINSADNNRALILHSDIVEATLQGNFRLLQLPDAISGVMSQYLPAYFPPQPPPKKSRKKEEESPQQFRWFITFQQNTRPLQAIVPNLYIAPGTQFNGNFSEKDKNLNSNFHSDKINYSSVSIRNINFTTASNASYIQLNGFVGRAQVNDTLGIENDSIRFNASNNDLAGVFKWRNNSSKKNDGVIVPMVHFESQRSLSLTLQKADIHLNDSAWSVVQGNRMRVDSGRVSFRDMTFRSGTQAVGLDGTVSSNPNDELTVKLEKFNIAYFNFFTQPNGITLKGLVSSNTRFADLMTVPVFGSQTQFEDLLVNDVKLGKGEITADWQRAKEAINIAGHFTRGTYSPEDSTLIDNISFHGNYYPKRKENSLDMHADLRSMELKILAPLLKDYCSLMNGQIDGGLNIKGTPAKPLLDGMMSLWIRRVVIDYLGLKLSAAQQPVEIMDNAFFFNDYKVTDEYGDTATIYGNLFHDNFTRFQLDMSFGFDHFNVLNTNAAQNDLYYGRVFGSGWMDIHGFLDEKIAIVIDLTTNKIVRNGETLLSEFNIPMVTTSEASSTEDFIDLVNIDDTAKKPPKKQARFNANGIDFKMSVHLNDSAVVRVIFDKTVGDQMTANGNGNIDLAVTPAGEFTIRGDYTVEQGKYDFTMQNIIHVPLDLAKGGTISWNGDPYKAQIDADAVYSVYASVAPFFPLDSVNPALHRNYQVNVVMHLDHNLMNPDIGFDINLPAADQNIQETVKSYTQTDLERNKQVLSLMVLRSFITPSELRGESTVGPAYSNAGSTLLSNFVSGTLNNWLSQVSSDLDVQVDAQDLKVLMRYQMMNNRLTFETNFGKMTASEAQTAEATTQWVGDVNVEYKVTADGRVRLQAFNRSNENTVLSNSTAPYTQGGAVFYREEFESGAQLRKRIHDFFTKENPNRNKKQPPANPPAEVPPPSSDSTGTK